jgi:benzoyl-CoA reductase/2-hydroxyglutaryl-CoA dehydratase subunit BcrC/BadD/HgdB
LRFGVDISDENIRAAIRLMNRERRLRRSLAELMKASIPPFTGRRLLDFKSLISGIPEDLDQYSKVLDSYRDCVPPASSAKPPVRVLMTGVPMVHGAERVLDLVESHGGLVVCMENCTGLKPILDDVDESAADPLIALAVKYFALPCSVKTPNRERLNLIQRLAKDYQVECVIELVWHACHTYNIEAVRVKRLAELELHLPYLKIETDYSPSDSARIAVRLEALFETIRSRGPG